MFQDPDLCNCHVYVLSFLVPCNDTSLKHVHYIFKRVSFGVGRNTGYKAAKGSKNNYLYYIFLDGDIHLTFNKYTKAEQKSKTPLLVFTEFLLNYQPAGAVVDYHDLVSMTRSSWYSLGKGYPMYDLITVVGYDACFNAYHRDAAELLFPLLNLDGISAWFSQFYIIYHVHVAFYGQIVRFPYITAMNPEHGSYKKGAFLDNRAIYDSIINEIKIRTPAHLRNHMVFNHLYNYTQRQFREVVHEMRMKEYICLEPPKPKSKIIPYVEW